MKKNIWHRALSLLAAMAMLGASLPVSVFAQEPTAGEPPVVSTSAESAEAENETAEKPAEQVDGEPVAEPAKDAAEETPQTAETGAALEEEEQQNASAGPAEEEKSTGEHAQEQPAASEREENAQEQPQPMLEDSAGQQGVQVNGENFPDETFRAWILNPANLNGIGQDGVLTDEELQTVTSINVTGQGIASLEGIQYFSQLKSLDAGSNRLTGLTLNLPQLEGLHLAYNRLTSLDLTGCPKLRNLNFEMNYLEQVDLSQNTELVILYSRHNQLTSLDLSHNTKLEFIETFDNRLTSIDVSMLPALKFLHVDENNLTTLDMSHNPNLEDSGFVGRHNYLETLVLPNVPGLQVDVGDFMEQRTRDGSSRVEWFYDEHFTQPVEGKSIPGNGQTLYAHWLPNQYTIQFQANGGAGKMEDLTTEYGQQFQLPESGFSRTGYTFSGWNTWPDGSGKAYTDRQQVSNLGGRTQDGEVVRLYARWAPNSYSIVYEKEGGQGSMNPTPATYDTAVNLADCQFSKDGEVFAGWSTRPGGPVEYENGQSVKNLTAENGGTVTLYAVWMDQTLLELNRAFAGYDRQDYIGEDWSALESACQEGQAAIEGAVGIPEKQAALAEAMARMADVPHKETRVSEITDAWENECEAVFELAATQPALEESAAAAKSAWQAVDKSWPETLVDYSSLGTPEGKNEAAALAHTRIRDRAEELMNFARAMDWLNAAGDLYGLEPEQVTSDKADRLALVMEEYDQMPGQGSIQPAIAARLTGYQELARAKKDAVAELESSYRALMENSYSQEALARLDTILQDAKARVEFSASADAAQEMVLQGIGQMEQVKPEPKPTQTPQPETTPSPTQKPETTPSPTQKPEATQTPETTPTPQPTQTPGSDQGSQGSQNQGTQTPQATQAPAAADNTVTVAAVQSESQQAVIRLNKPQTEQEDLIQSEQTAETESLPDASEARQPAETAQPKNGEQADAAVQEERKPFPVLPVAAGVAAAAAVLAAVWKLLLKK